MSTATKARLPIALDPTALDRLVELGLTPRQARVYLCIFETARLHCCQASIREMMDMFHISSPNGVVCHVKSLIRKGWLSTDGMKSRGLKILRTPDGGEFTGFSW